MESNQVIRSNKGVVYAEQLAPLLNSGKPPSTSNDYITSGSRVDESFMLPILTALDGSPEVTYTANVCLTPRRVDLSSFLPTCSYTVIGTSIVYLLHLYPYPSQVTEYGDIAYVFPSLQTSAISDVPVVRLIPRSGASSIKV